MGLLGALLVAPNATILKSLSNDVDPFLINTIRALVLTVLTLPFAVRAFRYADAKNMRYATYAGVCMMVALTTNIFALKYSQASYVTILSLMTPALLVLFSTKMVGEKINFKSAAGMTVAALGAFVAVAFPIILGTGSSMKFYPLATALIVLNAISVALGVIYTRKAHEARMPLTAVVSVSSVIILMLSALALVIFSDVPDSLDTISGPAWIGILYAAIAVAWLARILNVSSYEHIGAVTSGGLSYLQAIIAIIIPVVVLHEVLSIWVLLGGVIILLGIFSIEHHHIRKHRPHVHLWHR